MEEKEADVVKARELADMVGSIVVDEDLPLEVLELTADILKEDVRQIKEAATEIMKEARALHGTNTGTTIFERIRRIDNENRRRTR